MQEIMNLIEGLVKDLEKQNCHWLEYEGRKDMASKLTRKIMAMEDPSLFKIWKQLEICERYFNDPTYFDSAEVYECGWANVTVPETEAVKISFMPFRERLTAIKNQIDIIIQKEGHISYSPTEIKPAEAKKELASKNMLKKYISVFAAKQQPEEQSNITNDNNQSGFNIVAKTSALISAAREKLKKSEYKQIDSESGLSEATSKSYGTMS